ncbi:MAG: cupredoxin domain-containing protein [Vicinamibacterales bacterium]
MLRSPRRLRRSLASIVALGSLLWSADPGAAAGRSKPTTHTVVMEATGFTPAALTIAAGDAVIWVNKDPFPHTATSKPGKFDSGSVDAGKSWKFTARTKGEFDYLCTFHPTMKGTLRVK